MSRCAAGEDAGQKSTMRGKALLEALVTLAGTRGVTVRREPMTRGTSAGGLCVLKGVPTVLVDERANLDAQVEILARALRRYDWSGVELEPALRTVLTKPERPRPGPARVGTTPRSEP